MKLTRTSLLALIGVIASLLSINEAYLKISPYAVSAFFAIGGLLVYNLWKSDDESKVTINVLNVLFFLVGTVGYFIDIPVPHPDGTFSYVLPIATLNAIKESLVVLIRFWQANEALKNDTTKRAITH